MDRDIFLQHLREGSLEEGRARIKTCLEELTNHTAFGDALADEALKQLYNHFLSLKLSELLVFFGEITHDAYVQALGLKAKGDALVQIRHHQAAVECLDAAGELFLLLQDQRNWARSRISWIVGATSLGRVEEALQQATQARQIFESLAEPYWACAIDHNIAWIYKQVGQYHEAALLYEQMLTIYPQLTDQSEVYIKRAIAMAKGNQATTLAWLGKFQQAYRLQQEAQAEFTALKEVNMVANAEINLAHFDATRGYYGSALRRYYHAQDLLLQNKSNNRRQVAELKLQTAHILMKFNKADEACQSGHEAIEICKQLGASLHTSDSLREYATILAAAGKSKEALAVFNEAKELFERGHFRHHAEVTQLQYAELLLEMGDSSTAYTQACAVKKYFETRGLVARTTRTCLVMAGALIEQAQETQMSEKNLEQEHYSSLLQEAVLLCKQAALQARQYHLQEDVYKSQYLLGLLTAFQGDTVKALWHYSAAIAQIERILDDLVFDYSPSFLRTAWAVYEDAIILCLQCQQPERAFSYLERARSIALRQHLHTSGMLLDEKQEQREPLSPSMEVNRAMLLRVQDELKIWQDRYRSYSALLTQIDTSVSPAVEREIIEAEVQQCEAKLSELFERLYLHRAAIQLPLTTKKRKKQASLDIAHLRQHLLPHQLLLAYFLYKEHLIIFAVTSEQLLTYEMPDAVKQLTRYLPLLHAHLQPGGWPDPQQPPQQAVRVMLHRLYQLLVAPVQEILPARPGRLTIVPYGPLHSLPFHALYNGSRYLIEDFQINYLPASSILLSSTQATPASSSTSALILGYSGHGSLPRALEEATTLAPLLHGRCYLEDEATIVRLTEEAPGSPIIHLATHGHARLDAPYFSSIQLADGLFNAIDAFSLKLHHCELVTLSGCETGLALTGGGDEQLGLGRAFLAAGANTLVMSLWPVEDNATKELMHLFYQNLLQGMSKVCALHDAQCAFIHQSDSAYTHPYYWAAFRLVGDAGSLRFPIPKDHSQTRKIEPLKK